MEDRCIWDGPLDEGVGSRGDGNLACRENIGAFQLNYQRKFLLKRLSDPEKKVKSRPVGGTCGKRPSDFQRLNLTQENRMRLLAHFEPDFSGRNVLIYFSNGKTKIKVGRPPGGNI